MKTFIYLLFVCMIAGANASLKFVAPNGSDNGNGTINSPWKRPNDFIKTAIAGDTLQLREGHYTISNADTCSGTRGLRFMSISRNNDNGNYWIANSGTQAQPIVIMPYPGETVVVDSANSLDEPAISIGTIAGPIKYWIIQGLTIRGGFVSIGGDGVEYITIQKMKIQGGSNSRGNNTGAFIVDRGDVNGPKNIMIRDNEISDIRIHDAGIFYKWNSPGSPYVLDFACLTTLDGKNYGVPPQGGTGRIDFIANVCHDMPNLFYLKNASRGPVYIDSNTFYNARSIGNAAPSNVYMRRNLIYGVQDGLTIGGYGGKQVDSLWLISGQNFNFQFNTVLGVNNMFSFSEHGNGHTITNNVFTGLGSTVDYDHSGLISRGNSQSSTDTYNRQDAGPSILISQLRESSVKDNCIVPLRPDWQAASQYRVDTQGGRLIKHFNYQQSKDSLLLFPTDIIKYRGTTDSIFKSPLAGDFHLLSSLGCPVDVGVYGNTVTIPPVQKDTVFIIVHDTVHVLDSIPYTVIYRDTIHIIDSIPFPVAVHDTLTHVATIKDTLYLMPKGVRLEVVP